ncbi:MAG: right-handed parallel beta-helix repeat-containing protein [Deltaproteobacteria bacterium]|nr:right-handed parallel beta-helix repeat-containing protein [Deltaproteobacteria bacterium]
MKRQLWLLALVAAVLLNVAPVLADDIYVIGGGGVGTRIASLPYTISSPGFYYLTGSLSLTGSGNGITISSDDVTLDLMGFRVNGPGPNATVNNFGIHMSGRQNVEIRNGTLSGWWQGVREDGGARHRALNLRVESSVGGIFFGGAVGAQFLVKGCIVDVGFGDVGIYLQGGIASGNVVRSSAGDGIDLAEGGIMIGNSVSNCYVGINGREAPGGVTISGNSATNCSLYGIQCIGPSSVIGNTVVTGPSGSTGIFIGTSSACLVTQNTVAGAGTHFTPGAGTINVANTNAGF